VKTTIAILLSGLCLGLSQPLVIEFLGGGEQILGSHGLLGLLSLIGYAPLIYLLQTSSVGRVFKLAFFTSLVHFCIVLYWIVIACTVFGHIHLVISLLLLVVLSAALSCYIASAFAVAQFLHLRFGFAHYLVVPAAVCAVEYLRNYGIFGGFPWGNIGYGISQVSVFLQSASVVGVYGLVFLVVMINALLANFARVRFDISKVSKRQAFLFFVLLMGPAAFGMYRLSTDADQPGRVIRVALLQGNIDQGIKNQRAQHADEIRDIFRGLQDSAALQKPDLVVWPESSTPDILFGSPAKLHNYGAPAPTTVVGTVIVDQGALHNSAVVVDVNSSIKSRYHKSHLVPFGEYTPWPFHYVASKLVPEMGGGFKPGTDYKPVAATMADGSEIQLGLDICYEGVFPEITRTEAMHGADLLVNLTNDAWYGVSSAPYQHLHMYRLRAVETGLPFVRATNTGVSASIDTLGYIHHKTNLYETVMQMTQVPLDKRNTLYMTIGDIVPQLALIFVLVTFVLGIVGANVLVRRRAIPEWVLGALGIALIFFASVHFSAARAALVESATTKQLVLTVYGLILLIGGWSGRNFGRTLLIFSSGALMLLSFLIGLAEGYEYWVVSVLALAVAITAYVRAKAYP